MLITGEMETATVVILEEEKLQATLEEGALEQASNTERHPEPPRRG